MRLWRLNNQMREDLAGYLFMSPWLLGFVLLTAGPFLASIYYSFHSFHVTTPPRFIGLLNYEILLTADRLFWTAVYNTLYYAALSVPLNLVGGLVLGLLMNQPVPGIRVFRTIYYLPSVISGVAVSLLWIWMFNPAHGLINVALRAVGIKGPLWLQSAEWAKPALIIMSLWGIGGTMIIYLAGLKDIPAQLYEAASIDGANDWCKLWKITIPLLSPTIFFNLILSVIGSLQVFTQSFIMTGGGPQYATYFYVLHLYNRAFVAFEMGYASAMAWLLFVVILLLTALQFAFSRHWVYYEVRRART